MSKLDEKLAVEFKKSDERLAGEVRMFGMTMAALEKDLQHALGRGDDRLSYAVSLLSDAQEEMGFGQPERARQTINRAKKIILDCRRLAREGA